MLGLDLQELTATVETLAQPGYRAKQIFDAIYGQRVEALDGISTLPLEFRQALVSNGWVAGIPRIEKKFTSSDGTIRYLLGFPDGQSVETVWMPDGDGGEAGDGSEAGARVTASNRQRATICVSSQIGCAVDCQFCLTALLGVKRNLTAGEIVGQVAKVLNDQEVALSRGRVNLVFMGMGEPFLNYENFMKAVRLLVDGVGISESRMTVSTAGVAPRIDDLGREKIRPKLAISLNAPNDELRTRLMPINRKWGLQKLLRAAREFPLRPREKMTFEYVLLKDVNDSEAHARELAELVRGVRAKVNLIAFNPGPGVEFQTPTEESVILFQKALLSANIPAFVRRPRGRDIYAACGQLKQTTELASGLAVIQG
jgi:23S rRNA (adenine2503-C2)-methyltransferase